MANFSKDKPLYILTTWSTIAAIILVINVFVIRNGSLRLFGKEVIGYTTAPVNLPTPIPTATPSNQPRTPAAKPQPTAVPASTTPLPSRRVAPATPVNYHRPTRSRGYQGKPRSTSPNIRRQIPKRMIHKRPIPVHTSVPVPKVTPIPAATLAPAKSPAVVDRPNSQGFQCPVNGALGCW